MYQTDLKKFHLPDTVTKDGVTAMAVARRDYDKATSDSASLLELYTGMYQYMSDDDKRTLAEARTFAEQFGKLGIRDKINSYIEDVINKDKAYFSKLESYCLSPELLRYCL